jgi:MFS family permease
MNLLRRTGEGVFTAGQEMPSPKTGNMKWNQRFPGATQAMGKDNDSYQGDVNLVPVLFAVAVASCGAFAFGYHLGVLNGPLGRIASDLGFSGNPALQGLVVSSSLAGAAVGSLGGAGIADALGRRRAFFLDSIPLFLGAVICSMSTGIASMVAGRTIIGLGIGLSSALVPLYISEVCK